MTTTKPRRMARPPEAAAASNPAASEAHKTSESPAAPKRATKQDLVLELLQREGGAPLSVIVDGTGWLPHTARAALTGLRKKGYDVTRSKIEGETRYAVVAATA